MPRFITCRPSPVGRLTLCAEDCALTGLWIEGQDHFMQPAENDVVEAPDQPVLVAAGKWLDAYFAGRRPSIADLPLAPAGSDFRRRVWQLLCAIPYGTWTTYGHLARELAVQTGKKQMAAQAVGGAVGHNPLSIIIPCHRVLGSDGNLTGYAGGLHIKKWLLEHEGADLSGCFMPKDGARRKSTRHRTA